MAAVKRQNGEINNGLRRMCFLWRREIMLARRRISAAFSTRPGIVWRSWPRRHRRLHRARAVSARSSIINLNDRRSVMAKEISPRRSLALLNTCNYASGKPYSAEMRVCSPEISRGEATFRWYGGEQGAGAAGPC